MHILLSDSYEAISHYVCVNVVIFVDEEQSMKRTCMIFVVPAEMLDMHNTVIKETTFMI